MQPLSPSWQPWASGLALKRRREIVAPSLLAGILGAALAAFFASHAASRGGGGGEGDALAVPSVHWDIGLAAVAPKTRMGAFYGDLVNSGGQPLRILRVPVSGPGFNRTIRVVEERIGPITSDPLRTLDMTAYATDPPVYRYGRRCAVQTLRPLRGYLLAPGADARVWLVLEALRPGRWRMNGQTVVYRRGRSTYRQTLPLQIHGRVVGHGGLRWRPSRFERPCVHLSRLLPEP